MVDDTPEVMRIGNLVVNGELVSLDSVNAAAALWLAAVSTSRPQAGMAHRRHVQARAANWLGHVVPPRSARWRRPLLGRSDGRVRRSARAHARTARIARVRLLACAPRREGARILAIVPNAHARAARRQPAAARAVCADASAHRPTRNLRRQFVDVRGRAEGRADPTRLARSLRMQRRAVRRLERAATPLEPPSPRCGFATCHAMPRGQVARELRSLLPRATAERFVRNWQWEEGDLGATPARPEPEPPLERNGLHGDTDARVRRVAQLCGTIVNRSTMHWSTARPASTARRTRARCGGDHAVPRRHMT